jgi:hypothetical protein
VNGIEAGRLNRSVATTSKVRFGRGFILVKAVGLSGMQFPQWRPACPLRPDPDGDCDDGGERNRPQPDQHGGGTASGEVEARLRSPFNPVNQLRDGMKQRYRMPSQHATPFRLVRRAPHRRWPERSMKKGWLSALPRGAVKTGWKG